MARHPPAAQAVAHAEPPAAPRLTLTVSGRAVLERPWPYCILPGLECGVDLLLCRIQHATGGLLDRLQRLRRALPDRSGARSRVAPQLFAPEPDGQTAC